MPSQPISVYHSSDGVMHDVQFSFETRFHFTPWTFSSRSPMTDVEYADDTVLVARTQLTLHRFLHSLQHEASKHGLLLNPGSANFCASIPISPFISHLISPPLSPCSCLHCMGTDDLGVQIPPLQSAKYLGAYVAANASSAPDCNYRCSQAIGAFRSLCPVFTIRPSPCAVNCRCMRKLCLPSSSMGVDLKFLPLRRSQGSILFTIRFCDKSFKLKALTTIESFTPLRRTVPMILALPRLLSCPLLIPSQRISVQRLRYLGHLLRHFEALEHRIIFHASHALRRLSSPFRLGRPRAHSPEIALSEAFHRSEQLRRNQHPTTQEISHPMYTTGTQSMVHIYFGPSLADWYDTTAICNALSDRKSVV